MLKKNVMEIVKGEFKLGTMKETEEFVETLDKVFEKITEGLEERKEGASDKASLGSLTLEKKFSKGRTGEITLKDGSKKPWTSEDKFEVKGKIK